MTTVAFTPSNTVSPPFSASVELDGSQYTLLTVWNVYRGDWYYALTSQGGTILVFAPLIGSPPGANIYLAPGLFTTSTLLYRPGTGNFEVGP